MSFVTSLIFIAAITVLYLAMCGFCMWYVMYLMRKGGDE